MSCYEDGYYRRSGCYGYGTAFGYGPGFGSLHNGFRPQSCCPGGIGVGGPLWGRGPCGAAGGHYGCNGNPYSYGTIVTNLGCGTGVGTRGTGIAYGPYVAPCGPYLAC